MSTPHPDSPTSGLDVAIIGGGPAGATIGALLARAGRRVALFEKRDFPRFHVGESLIPAVNLTLERLDLLPRMDGQGFPRKHGVQFFSPKGPSRPFYFSESEDPRLHQTWQVLRSDFDHLLLECAIEAGLQVSTETDVLGVEMTEQGVSGVRVRGDAQGSERVIDARVVVDASGQRGLLAQTLGQREHIAGLENAAVFAHFSGVTLDTGRDAGSTLIYRLDRSSWLWMIPLPKAVSIGLVAPAQSISSFGKTSDTILDAAISRCEPLRRRLESASRVTDAHFTRDFSYRARQDGGPGWLLIGDALGFLDPVYSSGIFLTMLSAELGARAIDEALNGNEAQPDLAGFSAEYQVAFNRFLPLVQAFYKDGFSFGQLSEDPDLRRGLVDLLIGDVGTTYAIEVSRSIERLLAA